MKFKKHLLILPAVAIMSLGANFVFANNNTETNQETEVSGYQLERVGLVSRITGEVTEINEYKNDEVTTYSLIIKGEDSKSHTIFIEEDTVFVKDGNLIDIESIEKDMNITVHYMGSGIISGPMILDLNEQDLKDLENFEDIDINILEEGTTRFFASAIVVNNEESISSVHVDVFNKELISSDLSLRLVIDEDTVIMDKNGETYEGTLENKKLAVIYGVATKSMPSIPLNPKVIVLGEVEGLYDIFEKEEVKQPINMVDFLPPFARGNRNNYENYNEDAILVENVDVEMYEDYNTFE